ncbi:MAG: hypothetical protein DHS20C18_34930 [Saprospiraceae bacterium]|nr:MAG: hypothetical protein DHS20C18_34930 [Saprospiraceae bacterium]
MAQQFEFRSEDLENHQCETWREGDHIILHCETCGFKRKLNWQTGETHLIAAGDEYALHKATHAPVFSDVEALISAN